ncbi:hypothetical protein IFM89_028244 [Coptis chinensis]|uniref:RNase H type-1 domain-containing protein n=1 Tax=Coptis chinensis TaxID=261450 RepID=A0A835MFF6_9MAGN|nr:hypothetical protein IFM89_028244 [Coptis chinensis]
MSQVTQVYFDSIYKQSKLSFLPSVIFWGPPPPPPLPLPLPYRPPPPPLLYFPNNQRPLPILPSPPPPPTCSNSGPYYINRYYRWAKPLARYSTLNTDGSVSKNGSKIGGIIRNSIGESLIAAFANICPDMDVYAVEFWAIRRGLELALSNGVRFINVDTDSSIAITVGELLLRRSEVLWHNCRFKL